MASLIKMHSWVYSNDVVTIYKRGEQIVYTIPSKFKDYEKVEFPKKITIEDKINFLLKCLPKIERNGSVNFSQPTVCQSKYFHGYKVKLILLKNPRRLIWQIVDKKAQKSFFYTFNIKSLPSNASKQTVRFFNKIRHRKSEDIVSALSSKNMQILYVKDRLNPSRVNVTDFKLRPITYTTRLDPRVIVTRLTWTVTLLAYGRSKENTKEHDHAQILLEGVNDNGFFVNILDFDKGGVRIADRTKPGFSYGKRSETWKVSSRIAEKMLAEAKFERDAKNIKFGRLGPYEILTCKKNRTNCYMWVYKKFKIFGINLSPFSFILPLTRLYTKLPKVYKDNLLKSCKNPTTT